MVTRLVAAVVVMVLCAQMSSPAGTAEPAAAADPASSAPDWVATGVFRWTSSGVLVAPVDRPEDPYVSMKDPSIVRFEGKWHLFCSIRGTKRAVAVEYLSFADFAQANAAQRHVLTLWPGYIGAPQVFHFRPHRKWYLIFQMVDQTHTPPYFPGYSTTDDLADPSSWSPPKPLLDAKPPAAKAWLDFWIICDDEHAYLFFTSLDGQMWRMRTKLADFPGGWGQAEVALRGDVFEASHTYRLRGLDKYLTLIEAQGGGRRYYKAYLADRLDGDWKPLAATREKPFAAPANVRFGGTTWTDSFSHGELLRAACDERLEIDPAHLQFLYQGVSDKDMAGKPYGQIPWRLGLLKMAK